LAASQSRSAKRSGGRIADAKQFLRLRRDRPICEIAARLGAGAKPCSCSMKKLRGQLHHLVQRGLRRCLARSASGVTVGIASPAIAASRSTASGKVTPSVSMTKSKIVAVLTGREVDTRPASGR
jgi:hypothetical protein